MASPRVVVLVVGSSAHMTELWRVGLLLAKSGRYEPRFHFTDRFSGFEVAAAACTEHGIPYDLSEEDSWSEAVVARPGHIGRACAAVKIRLDPWLRRRSLGTAILVRRRRRLLRALVQTHRAALQDARASLLILPEDNVEQVPPWVTAARSLGIPSVAVPFAVANTEDAANLYHSNPHHWTDRLDNRYLAWRHPQWRFRFRDRTLVRLPAYQALALMRERMAPPEPWIFLSGHTDAIAVESPAMLEHYLAQGLPADRLHLTGSLADDELRALTGESTHLRETLIATHGLDPDRPVFVYALPPDQYGALSRAVEFEDYANLLEGVTEPLRRHTHGNAVLRMHPRVTDATHLEAHLSGLPLSWWDTARLVVACDVFVASVSSTIRWAIGSGIPVIDYDVYRFGYVNYHDVAGVVSVDVLDDYIAAIEKLACDADHRAKLREGQQHEAARWAMRDGKCGERLLSLFDALLADASPSCL